MAHIAKHGDKWRAQVAKLGVRKTAVWDTKREAQNWAAKLETEIAEGKHKPERKRVTLRQACDKYLQTVSVQKQDAVDWEGRRFEALCAYFGDDRELSTIDSNALGEWRDYRLSGKQEGKPEARKVTGSTVMREVNLYRNMFILAVDEWKWLDANPFKGVRLPDENPPREPVWRWQQIRRVLREGQRRGGKTLEAVQAFHIALRSAMRLQEALQAPAGFDSRRRIVMVKSKTSRGRPEPVPLTKAGFRLISTMKPFEVSPNEASVLFSGLCKELLIQGLQFRDSRATALTLLSRKVDILTLARISRHKNLDLLRSTYYRETAEEISARL